MRQAKHMGAAGAPRDCLCGFAPKRAGNPEHALAPFAQVVAGTFPLDHDFDPDDGLHHLPRGVGSTKGWTSVSAGVEGRAQLCHE